MDKNKLFKLAHILMKFAEVATDKGVLVAESDLEIGVEVQLVNAEGDIVPAEDGEYLTDTDTIKVEGGKVVDIQPIEQPEEPIEELAEEPIEVPSEQPNDEVAELQAKVTELEGVIAERDARIAKLEAEVEQLKNKPVEDPIDQKLSAHEPVAKVGALKYFN
jgi:hypothetical protein